MTIRYHDNEINKVPSVFMKIIIADAASSCQYNENSDDPVR